MKRGRVVIPSETRCKYVRVSSEPASLLATVSEGTTTLLALVL